MVVQEELEGAGLPRPHQENKEHIPHYFGDVVRQLFIGVVVLMLVGAPFYASTLELELPFLIGAALFLAVLAAFVNPHNRWVSMASAVAAGSGFVVYQVWALYQYAESSWMQFILREIIALVFLVALYYATKTVRAFIFHQVGKQGERGEFGA